MFNKIEVISLTKRDLREAIIKNLYWNKPNNAPISKNKALWMLSNNRIEEDDYCSVSVFDNEKLVGLVHLLPDLIRVKENKIAKFYWIISWWVEKVYIKTVVGPYIFNEALRLTNNKVLGKAYAEAANDFYSKQSFTTIKSRNRHTIFFALDASILVRKVRFLKYFQFMVNIFDSISFKFISLVNGIKLKNRMQGIEYEYINELDDEAWNFIAPFCEKDLVFKTKEYINWQINPLQYKQTPIPRNINRTRELSGCSENIHLHTFRVYKNKNNIGFVSLLKTKKEAYLKYFISNEKNFDFIVDALMEHLIKLKVNYIFTDDSRVAKNIKKRFINLYAYNVMKKGVAHNDIMNLLDGSELTERDGHFI